MKGQRNLAITATMPSATLGAAVGGVVSGVTGDVGDDPSNHPDLGEWAIAFLAGASDGVEELMSALTPDESALLKAALDDAANAQKRRGNMLHPP